MNGDNSIIGPHQGMPVRSAGMPLSDAKAAVVLIHGRGATAESILELRTVLDFPELAFLSPQASGHTWYPYSFLAPLARNEPGLSSGLRAIAETLRTVEEAGVQTDKIIIGGFSQGACLASEFVARNARRYGGLLVFSGGLVGPIGINRSYEGSLEGTPIFIGCSDRDPHIPLERVRESTQTLRALGGSVTEKIYPDMAHTIVQDEIDHAARIIQDVLEAG